MKAFVAIAACCGFAHAGDLQLTVHWVEIPHTSMTELLSEGRGDAALFTTVQKWVKDGQARVVDTVLLRGKPGERALSESYGEIIYPTEYEPPDLPNSKEQEEKIRRRIEGWARVFPYFPMFPAGWTGEFETRNVGESCQVDFPDESKTSEGTWSMELVSQARDTVITEVMHMDGELRPLKFPNFNRLAMTGAMPSSQWQLASVLTPKAAGGEADPTKKILVFARTDVLGD